MKKPSPTALVLIVLALLALVIPAIKIAKTKNKGKNPLLIRIWAAFWKNHMTPDDKVVAVKGWRTALIDGAYGCRRTSVLIPEWAFWDRAWNHYRPENKFWATVNKLLHRR